MDLLLVEDNAGDITLIQKAFADSGLKGRWHVARDGEQALAFLRRREGFQHSPRPSLIILDLNLPGLDGLSVLACIKQTEDLRQIPVLVLSNSTRQQDIAAAYALHANCYIPKPLDIPTLVKLGEQIQAFWLTTVVLPEPPIRESKVHAGPPPAA